MTRDTAVGPGFTQVHVALGARSYDVVIGAGALEACAARVAQLAGRRRLPIVADATAADLHADRLIAALARVGVACDVLPVAPGEGSKSFRELERVTSWLLDAGLERGEAVGAFGGGVVGDLVGLAAGLVKRGVPFIQFPTTLLSQVDSSVGGKTAINAPQGKNLIGVFHQPALVVADLNVLDTLDARDLRAGYAEIVKIAVAADAAFFAWLEAHGAAVLGGDRTAQLTAISRAVELKAEIVAQDEREAGRRALLNLGHTFGHGLEAEAGYASGLRHGEAVAGGMALAMEYACAHGRAAPADLARLRAVLASAGLPQSGAETPGGPFDPDAVLARMDHDKKNTAGVIRLVLPDGLGAASVTPVEDRAALAAFLRAQLSSSSPPETTPS